ncbi:hypothetical protein SASPL_138621 [Salvia splendens]|uniref:Uncharacterized protein n=1 Tax=Salvia splendens TaxID=180675 RepID=A0A8X8ZEB8_SALSN|nr:hypothetical protein SASPL_138621 [Salvia splendens]
MSAGQLISRHPHFSSDIPASDSRCSATAAHRQVVVSIDHLPLALAVVQEPSATAASPAAVPPPLLKSWLRQHQKASSLLILPKMKSIGYTPDCGTCNYLFLTL